MSLFDFKKDFRLLTTNDFNRLKVGSKKYYQHPICVYYKESDAADSASRIGISVSRKVGKAFIRNRVKRLIRESYRRSAYKHKGLDFIVVVLPSIFRKRSCFKQDEHLVINSFNKFLSLVSD